MCRRRSPPASIVMGPGDTQRRSEYPILAGQPAAYLEQQLKLFSIRARGGSDHASLMLPIVDKLDEEQMRAFGCIFTPVLISKHLKLNASLEESVGKSWFR
jgi:cytochrome c553